MPTHFLLRGRIPAGEEVYAADCALTQISAPPGTDLEAYGDWLSTRIKEEA